MTTTGQLACALDGIAPAHLAEDWDNVGLLVGSHADELEHGPVLITIDLTSAVAAEAIAMGARAVVAYHPPIFKPLKRLTDASNRESGILRLVRTGASILSPHTALDAAPDGLGAWLARTALGEGESGRDLRALAPHTPGTKRVKLVTFVPESSADAVRRALASVGAGVIGAYTECSFASPGIGTFVGGAGTNPAVGRAGALERTPELRLEMVCPAHLLGEATVALRSAHPYEEPAYDVVPLAEAPDLYRGGGRAITLDTTARLDEVAQRVRTALGVPVMKVARGSETVTRVGVCPGSGGSLVNAAISQGCDCFLTGEMTHHEALAAIDQGCSVLLAGHTNTERPYMPTLADRLRAELPGLDIRVSQADAAPFSYESG